MSLFAAFWKNCVGLPMMRIFVLKVKFEIAFALFFAVAVYAEKWPKPDDERGWNLGFTGEVSFYGSHQGQRGEFSRDERDGGGEVSLDASLEWERGSLTHELNVATSYDATSERDSSSWTFTPSLDYSLMASSFIVDVNVDFNFSSDRDLLLGYMLWLQGKLWKEESYSLNLAGWTYYRDDGRLLANAEINLRKFVREGLGGKVSLGFKADGDTLVSRMGPAAKMNFSYKFPGGLSFDFDEGAFYGFVRSTVYSGAEEVDELKISGDVRLSLKKGRFTLYAVLRSIYRIYFNIPVEYSGIFAQERIYHCAKVGVRVDF